VARRFGVARSTIGLRLSVARPGERARERTGPGVKLGIRLAQRGSRRPREWIDWGPDLPRPVGWLGASRPIRRVTLATPARRIRLPEGIAVPCLAGGGRIGERRAVVGVSPPPASPLAIRIARAGRPRRVGSSGHDRYDRRPRRRLATREALTAPAALTASTNITARERLTASTNITVRERLTASTNITVREHLTASTNITGGGRVAAGPGLPPGKCLSGREVTLARRRLAVARTGGRTWPAGWSWAAGAGPDRRGRGVIEERGAACSRPSPARLAGLLSLKRRLRGLPDAGRLT